jgi:putative helicase MOV10L1
MHETDSPSWFNPVEGSKIVDLIEGLLNSSTVDVSIADIGVIAFYRQQVLKIRLMLRERGLSQVRVGGVNDYQGQEARIIFISTVVAKQRQFDPAVDPIGTYPQAQKNICDHHPCPLASKDVAKFPNAFRADTYQLRNLLPSNSWSVLG